jgi:hypothetical protein
MVGGTVFSKNLGHEYSKIDSSFFGYCKRIIISKDRQECKVGGYAQDS